MQDWAEIRRLHVSEGLSVRAIAKLLGLSRVTVTRAVQTAGARCTVSMSICRIDGKPCGELTFGDLPAWANRQFRQGFDTAWVFVGGHAFTGELASLPLLAPSVRGVAPALIAVGEGDILRDEDIQYADRLRDAGVEVELVVFPNEGHFKNPAGDARQSALIEELRKRIGTGA